MKPLPGSSVHGQCMLRIIVPWSNLTEDFADDFAQELMRSMHECLGQASSKASRRLLVTPHASTTPEPHLHVRM